MKKQSKVILNRRAYPLYVGGSQATNFGDWDGKGSSVLLTAKVVSEVFNHLDIVWSIENTEIVDFDADSQEVLERESERRIRARRTGITAVIAQLPDGISSRCVITVIDNFSRLTVSEVVLNTSKLHLQVGKNAQLIPILYPKDIYGNGMLDTSLIWESKDRCIAWVKDGTVTAVGTGETDIVVYSVDVNRSAICHVTISEVVVDDLQQKATTEVREMYVGEQLELHGDAELLVWQSDNRYIADVNENGCVKATSASIGQRVNETGMIVTEVPEEVWIYATHVNGGSIIKYPVRIKPIPVPVQYISINPAEISIPVGEKKIVTVAMIPIASKDCSIAWETNAKDILTVTPMENTIYGTFQAALTAKCEGEAVVTGFVGNIKASCKIHVTENIVKMDAIYMDKQLKIDVDQVFQLQPTMTKYATNSKLWWIGTNFAVATLDREGNVQGYSPGESRIYAIADDSLSQELRKDMEQLCENRNILSNSEELQKFLDASVYAECILQVNKGIACLRNLHAVEEAKTDHSILLLWNRTSLLDTGEFDRYVVYCNGNFIAETKKLGYRVEDLKPLTMYSFQVTAVDKAGNVLAKSDTKAVTGKKSQIINVLDYGAAGNGKSMDTFFIQKAIDDCPEGGTVWLPEHHIFVSGALFLKCDMTFRVDGILFGSSNPKDYPRVITRWEGWRKLEQTAEAWENSTLKVPANHCPHASLLNAGCYEEGNTGETGPYNVENLVICGKGQILANGFTLAYNEGPNINSIKVVSRDYPVKDATSRGSAIRIHNGRNIYLKDIQVAYAPGWTVHAIYCKHITFDGMEIVSQGDGDCGEGTEIPHCGHIFNGDGIDPESCVHVNMFDIFFTTGDDAVAMKSGRNREGNDLDKPNAYIRVTDCISRGSLGGFGTGSETASGSHDILFQNLTVEHVLISGIWLKSCPERGGITEYIQVRDLVAENCDSPVWVFNTYSSTSVKANPSLRHPIVRHLTFEHIQGKENNKRGFVLEGSKDFMIQEVTFRGISNGGRENKIAFCKGLSGLEEST